MIRKDPGYLYKERIRVFSSFGGDEVDPGSVNWWGPEAERYVFRQDRDRRTRWGSFASTCRTSTSSTCTIRR